MLATSVRVVAQPGCDEVVLELSGAAGSVPGFRVRASADPGRVAVQILTP